MGLFGKRLLPIIFLSSGWFYLAFKFVIRIIAVSNFFQISSIDDSLTFIVFQKVEVLFVRFLTFQEMMSDLVYQMKASFEPFSSDLFFVTVPQETFLGKPGYICCTLIFFLQKVEEKIQNSLHIPKTQRSNTVKIWCFSIRLSIVCLEEIARIILLWELSIKLKLVSATLPHINNSKLTTVLA